MQATAIIPTAVVNCDNRLTEGLTPAAGDFMKVLNQQVTPLKAGPDGKAALSPEALTALLELLQKILGVTVNQLGETAQQTTPEITGAQVGQDAGVMAAENPAKVFESAAVGQANVLDVVNIITDGQKLKGQPAAQGQTVSGDSADLQRPFSMQSGAIPLNMLKVIVGHDARAQLQVLQQKISQVAGRLAAGKDVAGELNGLIKSFGGDQVLLEVKGMLDKLTGSAPGVLTDPTIKTPVDRPFVAAHKSVDMPVMTAAEKPVDKSAETTAEKTVKETSGPLVQLIRNTETDGSRQQGAGRGTAENPVFTVQVPAAEAQARFNYAVPGAENKAPVNSLARWTDDILGKIGEKTRLILGGGQSEMQIQLKPDFLGKVNLQVTVENGSVTARIGVENMQVKELVEANLKQLQQNLDNQGIKVGNLVVDLTANRQFHHFNRPQDHRTGKTIRFKNSGADEGYGGIPTAERVEPAGLRSMDSTVDYIA